MVTSSYESIVRGLRKENPRKGVRFRLEKAAKRLKDWHTTVWSIWRSRNDIMFANGVRDVNKVVEDIKLLSWRWGLCRQKIPMCLFYEWCWDPGICLRR
ncbi:pantothenate synthetase [Trifolium medium]|uniref:Pantothenate synthetase n=1 Tax=Trifolium medium TaxID=97028 RepID=A0A392PIV3_9FABA|nr:pantothenate synthetase [Trifolium medium]